MLFLLLGAGCPGLGVRVGCGLSRVGGASRVRVDQGGSPGCGLTCYRYITFGTSSCILLHHSHQPPSRLPNDDFYRCIPANAGYPVIGCCPVYPAVE